MAFPLQEARRFDADRVADAPDDHGFYGLFRVEPDGTRSWVYVGFGQIRRRLQEHLDGQPPEIARHRPTHWVMGFTAAIEGQHERLVRELQPILRDDPPVDPRRYPLGMVPPEDEGSTELDLPVAEENR